MKTIRFDGVLIHVRKILGVEQFRAAQDPGSWWWSIEGAVAAWRRMFEKGLPK